MCKKKKKDHLIRTAYPQISALKPRAADSVTWVMGRITLSPISGGPDKKKKKLFKHIEHAGLDRARLHNHVLELHGCNRGCNW